MVRPPVIAIGDEARPVVAAPELVRIAQARLRPDPDRAIRLPLPEASTPYDPSAIVVEAQLQLENPPEDVLELGSQLVHFEPMGGSWTLESDPKTPGRTIVVIAPKATEGVAEMDVRVQAMRAPSALLESRDVEIAADSRLLLGYGLSYAEGIASDRAAELRATLVCKDATYPLHHDTLTAADVKTGGWRSASVSFPEQRGPCKVRLETTGPRDVRDRAVWAVPVLLSPVPHDGKRDDRNLVLISLDTLRADHLSGYGYPRATSPSIDRELISRGTVFEDVSTTFPLTSIAHLSLFTSLYPGAQPPRRLITSRTPIATLAERLAAAGFETAAYTEDALLTGVNGAWSGYDQWTELALGADERGERIFADGARYLRENVDGKFFLFLHTYKVHEPYRSAARYDSFFTEPIPEDRAIPASMQATVDAYDRAIREADDMVAGFLEQLEELNLADRTVVAIVSDHGEAFLEHGLKGHGSGAHQEQLNIPWIVRGPGVSEGLRIETPVSLVDVAPTLLGLLGASAIGEAQGRDLSAALAGDAEVLATQPLYFDWMGGRKARGVRHGRWKYLETRREEQLFDLGADPRETKPQPPTERERELLATHAKQNEELKKRYAADSRETPAIRSEVRKSLKALGYLQ